MKSRGVTVIRYTDDIVVLAESKRAATRFLESCGAYLENRLKLKMNAQKSKVVSVVAQKHFKFLGFALGKNGSGVYIRVHGQSLAKAKRKLKGADEPKARQKRPAGDGEREGLHSQMDRLFLYSRHEANPAKLE
ncbi:reverse transcriptase domain-containing protein [Paenibacillus terrae]|uniref:reverse transcriptase domain-containing protein n=1 Tax=Paenibacillus terrae TaxID=159743 RepID=UPI000A7A7239|nr:reverse transcriptase domain-containing protein [Paenibacillus terrae]